MADISKTFIRQIHNGMSIMSKHHTKPVIIPFDNPDYNPLLTKTPKKLSPKLNKKGVSKTLQSPADRLRFQTYGIRKMKIDRDLQILMRELWFRKRRTNHDASYLGDYYELAFAEFLFKNKIPKTIPRIKRQTTKLMLSNKALADLESMVKIARKRGQTINHLIEEALKEYLSKPENYLGENFKRRERIEHVR
jgi:hypothetical protein